MAPGPRLQASGAAIREPGLRRLLSRFHALPIDTRLLLGLWAVFALLVALGIHGSSLPAAVDIARALTGDGPAPTYVMSPVARVLDVEHQPKGVRNALLGLLMMEPRKIRSDEWAVSTLWAIGQSSHEPPYPVVNDDIGAGQIMLIGPHTPVLHPSALARPSTWGYLLFGPASGLAWSWWFAPFASFTALYLLLRTVLRGDRWLAAFGAFWFGTSAFVVCWSHWPAYMTFFPAAATLAVHRLLTSSRPSTHLACGGALGLLVPGFAMCSYPAWQVPLGWLFLALTIGLVLRDRPLTSSRRSWAFRAAGLGLAALLSTALLYSYVSAALPGMRALLGTVYPGSRFHPGGGFSFAWLLRGYYNVWTSFARPGPFENASEASSFLHLFPAVIAALALSSRVRRAFGWFGWLSLGFLASMLLYMFAGYPRWLAAITFMSRAHPPRVDIVVGLTSIFLCVWFLHRFSSARRKGPVAPEAAAPAGDDPVELEKWVPFAVGAVVFALTAIHASLLRGLSGSFPTTIVGVAVALAAGLVSYSLAAGKRRVFLGSVSVAVLVTSVLFNPLSVGIDYVREGELAREVSKLDREAGGRPLWLCYGSLPLWSVCGSMISAAGARSLTGVFQYPQLALWRAIDPDGRNERAYNRYAHVTLEPNPEPSRVGFDLPLEEANGPAHPPDTFLVRIDPSHEALRKLGAKFVVAIGEDQSAPGMKALKLRYRARNGGFSIYEIP